jgi:MFS family permease
MSSAPASDFRLRNVAVAAFGPSALFGLSQGAILPIVAISAIDRGANESVASIVVASIGIGALISNIPAGVLTNRFGERRSMIAAAAITMLGLVLCLLPSSVFVFSLGVLLTGVASSVFMLARQSYLTDLIPVEMRARSMSMLGGVQRIGAFVGPFAGAGVIALWGLDAAYVLSLVAILGAGVIAYTVPDLNIEHTGRGDEPVTTVAMAKRHWHTLVTLGTGIVLLSAIRQTRQVVIPLWAHHIGLDATTSSIIFGISGGIEVLVFYPAGVLMDRWGRRWIASGCTLVMGISFVLMPLSHHVPTLIAVATIMGLGNGIGSGIVNTLGADVAPAVGRPVFLGLWRELSDGGSSIGPIILSVVSAVSGLGLGIVVSGVVGFAGAAVLWKWVPRPDLGTRRRGTDQARVAASASP